jgi:plastocyanin
MRRAICLTGLFALLAGPATAATQTVNVGPGIAFSPPTTTVTIGDTVTWNFVASFHSTTSDATTGPETWDSGVVLSAGTMFSHTFTNSGTYPYYCKVHSSAGGTAMNGVVIVNAAAPTATHFAVTAPSSAPSNSSFTFTVTALDSGNATVTGYSGTVHFSSTDASATVPANSPLTAGVGTFSATLRTIGVQTLTAADTVSSAITGSASVSVTGAIPALSSRALLALAALIAALAIAAIKGSGGV